MRYEENDRLTSLPREILINIISCLPTKLAVATAILSRSYRHLWTNITTLRFTITDFPGQKFQAILFIIIRRVSWRHINVIELTLDAHPLARITSDIIHDIIYNGTNIKEFKVFFENYGRATVFLPCSIFKKQSLEVLELYGTRGIYLREVKVNHTNLNLRKLVISIRELDLNCFGNLLKSCHLLETLHVHVDMVMKFEDPIKINAQNLKYLSVNLIGEKYSINNNKIMIDTPKLKYFEVNSPFMVKFCFLKTSINILKANLFMRDRHKDYIHFPKHVMSVFNPISRVKTLKLSGDLLHALLSLDFKLEVFNKLTHLEVGLTSTLCWHGLKCFLNQCPNIECLVLKRIYRANWDDINWSEIDILPCCLQNKIQKIELLDLVGNETEIQLLRYIFGVAKDLKMLYITIEKQDYNEGRIACKKGYFLLKLFDLSKELPTCEIGFGSSSGIQVSL